MESEITRLEIYTTVKTYSYRVFQESCEDVPQSVPSNRREVHLGLFSLINPMKDQYYLEIIFNLMYDILDIEKI